MAEALADGNRCRADDLADELVADAEAAAVPADYRARLLAAARSLAATIECPPPPPVEDEEGEDRGKDEDDDGNRKGNGKGKGEGEKGDG